MIINELFNEYLMFMNFQCLSDVLKIFLIITITRTIIFNNNTNIMIKVGIYHLNNEIIVI